MASSTISWPPVRISKVAGRYLLFDIDDVMHLRKNHNICSVFVGTIPQNPQQNIFMGLPIELMPEEAQVLVDKNVAYIVDDAAFHSASFVTLDDDARRRYLQSVKAEGRKAQMAAAESKLSAKPKITTTTTTTKKEKEKPKTSENEASLEADDETSTSLFSPPSPPPPSGVSHSQPSQTEDHPAFAITPTTSSLILPPSPPHVPPKGLFPFSASVNVPPSYPLYAHLQDRGYYMMPGLRFGCDYNVYPGDPLRFHSHFQAASYGWEEEIAVLDLVAGGRLGTNVKKGYLIGGAVVGDDTDEHQKKKEGIDENPKAPRARAFCIEWAAM